MVVPVTGVSTYQCVELLFASFESVISKPLFAILSLELSF